MKKRLAQSAICLVLFLFSSSSFGFSPEQEFKKAVGLFKAKQYPEALKAFEALDKQGPDFSPAERMFVQGQTLRALQRWAEAAQAFCRSAEQNGLLADYALFYEAEARQMNGEIPKSLEAFERLMRRHPDSLLIPEAQISIAEILLTAGDYARSAEVSSILKEYPRKEIAARAFYALGQAREGQARWSEAYRVYQEGWLRFPLDPVQAKIKGRMEFLIKEKQVPVEKIPPEALFRRALQYLQANLCDTALKEMDRLEGFPARAYPQNYAGESWIDDLYFHRAVCLFRLKEYAKAVDAFGLVALRARNRENSEKSHFWMAWSLFRQGRKDEALERCSLLQRTYPRGALLDQTLSLKAKIFEEKGDIFRAISVYRELCEKCLQSPLRSSSLWQIGWLLFNNRDFPGALQAWDSLLQSNPKSIWIEKGLYWKAKVLHRMGRREEAERIGRQLGDQYPASYYSQSIHARGESSPGGRKPVSLEERPPSFYGEIKAQGARTLHLEKGKSLVRLGLPAQAAEEMQAAEEKEQALEEVRIEISRIYREAGEFYRSARVVRKNFRLNPLNAGLPQAQRVLYALAYPLGNASLVHQYSRMRNIDPALLFALILEESRYNAQVISAAGARGLMQLMPRTGRQISARLGLTYTDSLLFDAEMNIRLGTYYFERLLQDFGGREALALAAYNAGPQAVRQWMAARPGSAEDEFVENIPFGETRNYVIRVLTSAQIYRTLYGAGNSGKAQ